MILAHEGDYPSRWSAVVPVTDRIGCAPQTLHERVKKAEVDSGKHARVPTDNAFAESFSGSFRTERLNAN